MLVVGCFLFSFFAHAAEQFGDVSVEPHAIYTGNTFHGYAEIRVTLENHSHTKAHGVTLVYPGHAYSSGNSIGRLARSVKLAPDAREIVSLLQPPLASQGDNQIRVEVDGRGEGEVHAPNANNHCNYYGRSGDMATVFISRSLDYDAVEKVFHANSGAFTASKAVGAPDAGGSGRGGFNANSWMPDTRSYGRTNWLELDYATPQTANKIIVRNMQPLRGAAGAVVLIGASGTNLARIAMSSGSESSPGSGWEMEFSFPTTSEPVKTVRLDFAKTQPHMIAIDAVQIAGPSGSQWASAARASSDNSASAASYGASSGAADAVESLRAESPVSEWSDNWLAYTPFDAVVIGAGDLSAMTPAVFAALGDYLHAGGNLVLLGKGDLPVAWHAARVKKLHDGAESEIGFGNCFAFATENPAALTTQSVARLREVVRETARYWQSLPNDSGAANGAMPVVESLKIPVRGIVIIMLAFIIVIGPVNIFYLNRKNRRTWMLWTIPAISVATTLLVFAYSLLREGITPDTRIAGVTVLDQASHHAATIGGEAFYCPLTPSGGLHFDFGTEATPLVAHGYGSGNSREVDWTQSQHFTHGWVSARVPAHFHIRKTEPRRERIQVVNENGKLQIVNSLGAPIKSLWFADANMNFYQATGVGAGQKAGLLPSNQLHTAGDAGANGLLHEIGYAGRTDALDGIAIRSLQPNTYIAVLEGNPFIENALGSSASAKRTKSSAVVFGILGAEDKAGGGK